MRLLNAVNRTVCLLAFSAVTATAWAQDNSEVYGEPTRCIDRSRIESTRILGGQRILFRMRGGTNYINELPYACPGLNNTKIIMYRTSIDEICDVDVFTVGDRLGGGIFPGASCGLGKFYRLNPDEAKALIGR